MDEATKKSLSSIPLLTTKAGPRDKELWPQRLKEEYQALIKVSVCGGHVAIWFMILICHVRYGEHDVLLLSGIKIF